MGRADNAKLSTSTIATSATAPDFLETAPAAELADEAENPAPTGIPWNAAETTLQVPSTNSSRFAFKLSPRGKAKFRMLPQDSANTNMTNPNAISTMRTQSSYGIFGTLISSERGSIRPIA
jgi:hypothetical protein